MAGLVLTALLWCCERSPVPEPPPGKACAARREVALLSARRQYKFSPGGELGGRLDARPVDFGP